jgi:AraC-like DNA-binding protein
MEGFRRVTIFLQILELLAGARDAETLASAIYSPSAALRQGSRINAACELISRRFRHGITQAEAARLVKMSPASFSRFFRRATNRTFRTFVNEVRLGHAAQQLTETDRTVAEICYDSGFANLSNFNRQFLRRHRTTPRAYRRRLARA